jgi:hypothetical protein
VSLLKILPVSTCRCPCRVRASLSKFIQTKYDFCNFGFELIHFTVLLFDWFGYDHFILSYGITLSRYNIYNFVDFSRIIQFFNFTSKAGTSNYITSRFFLTNYITSRYKKKLYIAIIERFYIVINKRFNSK